MKYSIILRKLFEGLHLRVEDLFLLESFQVSYLPERVPQKEFATLVRRYPYVKEFLIVKNPSIKNFLEMILKANKKITNKELIREYCEEALWEIADLIIYNKFPELYDEKVSFNWDMDEIVSTKMLNGKTVADVGAGAGMLAFLLAEYAQTVFAIEPITSFRTFMKQKAESKRKTHLFVLDGLLESIPLPDNSLDMLFTSNSIGWNIEKELREIERVVKPNGLACHLMRIENNTIDKSLHKTLLSGKWNYEFSKIMDGNSIKVKYLWKNRKP